MLRLSALTILFLLSSLAHAKSLMNCWSFTDFSKYNVGIHELRLKVLPSEEVGRPIHIAELTVTAINTNGQGLRRLEKHPTRNLTCVPAKNRATALRCYGEDDRGKMVLSAVDGGVQLEIYHLDTTFYDRVLRQERGLALTAPRTDPYVAFTNKKCKQN